MKIKFIVGEKWSSAYAQTPQTSSGLQLGGGEKKFIVGEAPDMFGICRVHPRRAVTQDVMDEKERICVGDGAI